MKKSSISFTGDIGFDRYMDHRFEDPHLLSDEVLSFLHESDHIVANVEGALIEESKAENFFNKTTFFHTMNPEAISFFRLLRADIWNLANNHTMDAGPGGMESTLSAAESLSVHTIGAGMNLAEASRPHIINEAGGIGLIGVGYQRGCYPAKEDFPGSFNWEDLDLIGERIREIKKTCRWCVIVSHGGEEFTCLPSPYTRDRYIRFLDMGADIVVSHHPHVPMNYELFPGKAIFYSLGNFIFDTDYQRAQYNTDRGILLKIHFTEDDFTFEALGTKINRENETVEKGEVPEIFTDVPANEYELLKPLAAKMFIEATKRIIRFTRPEDVKDFTGKDWEENFLDRDRKGRLPNEAQDFMIMYPLALQAENGTWKMSQLENVKKFIIEST